MEGFPGFPVFPGHTDTQAGEKGTADFTGKHHFPLTYVFVRELALVPVVQVNELGCTLLLSIHPGPHVLAAGLCVEISALPVPGGDRGTEPLDPKHEKPPGCVGRPFTEGPRLTQGHGHHLLSLPQRSMAPSPCAHAWGGHRLLDSGALPAGQLVLT